MVRWYSLSICRSGGCSVCRGYFSPLLEVGVVFSGVATHEHHLALAHDACDLARRVVQLLRGRARDDVHAASGLARRLVQLITSELLLMVMVVEQVALARRLLLRRRRDRGQVWITEKTRCLVDSVRALHHEPVLRLVRLILLPACIRCRGLFLLG